MMLIVNLASYKAYKKVAHITLVVRLRGHPFCLRGSYIIKGSYVKPLKGPLLPQKGGNLITR